MDAFALYQQRQRQFEQRKQQAAIEQPIAATVQPVAAQPIISPQKAFGDGLLGEYTDLDILLLAIEEQNEKRKRAKKGAARDTENELALRKFKPIIEKWIEAKVILDRKIFALVVYFAIGAGDYPLLIAMCDLSIELKIIDFDPILKRELQSFIVDELWELCKRDYWYQPDGKGTRKTLKKPMPDWFWTIFDRVVTTKQWATIWFKQNMMLQIAGYDADYRCDEDKAIYFWEKCEELSERSGVKTRLNELKALKEKRQLNTTSS